MLGHSWQPRFLLAACLIFGGTTLPSPVFGQENLETRLTEMGSATLAAQARFRGNPQRGALLFFKSAAGCAKCHSVGEQGPGLGPPLVTLGKETTDVHVVESLLEPSKVIRKGFETLTVQLQSGQAHAGLVVSQSDERLVLRNLTDLEREIVVPRSEIERLVPSPVSLMPRGLVAALNDEQEFFDLVRYVGEVARGGAPRAAQLQPSPEELQVRDDTQDLDHSGILGSLDSDDLEAGRDIFQTDCIHCHGADGNAPQLATARAFGRQALKFGADPYRMFLSVSRGAGLMPPLQHLSPRERYQVVYYIRETFMKPSNPAYAAIDEAYLAGLPQGRSRGERVWAGDRDYGPALASQVGNSVNSALTFRLPQQVTVSYDLHRGQLVGAWRGGFLDLSQTQHFRQRGEGMPKIEGEPLSGLGEWRWKLGPAFDLPANAKPPRGPVRDDWLHYRGHYLHGDRAILSQTVQGREILESVAAEFPGELLLLEHALHIGPGAQPLELAVARLAGGRQGLLANGKYEFEGRSGPAGESLAVVSGPREAAPPPAVNANRPRHVVGGEQAQRLDLGTPDRTFMVRFRTKGKGTLLASAPAQGEWKPDGKTLYVSGGRLVFDIGWVGAITGRTNVGNGEWHTAAVVVEPKRTRLFLNGKPEAEQANFRRPAKADHVLKIGATATNFGGDFTDDIGWVRIFEGALAVDELKRLATSEQPPERAALFAWQPEPGQREPAAASPPEVAAATSTSAYAAVAVRGDTEGLTWRVEESGLAVLVIPPSDTPRKLLVVRCPAANETALRQFADYAAGALTSVTVPDLPSQTRGGPTRWPQVLAASGKLGEGVNGYALDTLPVPFENPWNAWLRTSALDFFEDGRAVVTTHCGDVYLVSGIDASLARVTWKRFAAGLFEPFGVRVVKGVIYVTCRDGLKRLHDFDGNGEADFIEAFWNDDDVSCQFHAYNFDLQTDSQGNFYFAKAGQYTHHHRPGTIMKIPPAGQTAEVVAWGLRTPNGMGTLDDGRFTVSDNQGPWMPAGKVSLIRPGGFLGNMPINDEQRAWLKDKHGGSLPDSFDEPLVYTPQELDNSCGGQVWVADSRFGPLAGRLFHSSFGKGWLYYLSLQQVGDKTQASIVALPHQWQAGVMRLRVNPGDGQLYGTGLSGWQGPRGGADGCLQRLRYTGEPVRMIESVRATPTGLELRFNFALAANSAGDTRSWSAEMWNYLWSAKYGSDQFSVLKPKDKGRDTLNVAQATVEGEKIVRLTLPQLAPCDQLWLRMNIKDAAGEPFVEQVYLTVHALPDK